MELQMKSGEFIVSKTDLRETLPTVMRPLSKCRVCGRGAVEQTA
jgi:hypothetical protein